MTETTRQHKHGVSTLQERSNKKSCLKAHHALLMAKFSRKVKTPIAKAISVTFIKKTKSLDQKQF